MPLVQLIKKWIQYRSKWITGWVYGYLHTLHAFKQYIHNIRKQPLISAYPSGHSV